MGQPARRARSRDGADAARKEAGRESSTVIYRDGEMPRLYGKGISFHLAMYISGALVVILAIFGIVLYNLQSKSLDEQIDSGGIEAVRILATTDIDCWGGYHGTRFDGVEKPKGTLSEAEERRYKLNIDRLVPLVEGDTQVLVAMIKDQGGTRIKRAAYPGKFEYDSSVDRTRKVGEVSIFYGNTFLDNRRYSTRTYRAPVMDASGERSGWAEIVLSEAQIDSSKENLFLTILILVVIFMCAGIGVSFLMGKRIAVPVKRLIEDVSIVAGGDLDHHTVPKSQDEIGLLARTFDKMTKNLKEAQEHEMELAAQRHQLAVAQEVQDKLLPEMIPQMEGYEIQAYHRSSKEMGGNYYDVIQFPGGKVAALVASASGRGVPAAMVMTMARSFMRAQTYRGDDLHGIVRECNRLLSPDLRAGMYVEILIVLVDPQNHKGRIVSAGPTMLIRFDATNRKVTAVQADGIAMGFDKGPVFERILKEAEVEIGSGDRLVLATEGLFKLKSPAGEELGAKGFARFVAQYAAGDSADFVRGVVAQLDVFAGGREASGITFVTIKRTA